MIDFVVVSSDLRPYVLDTRVKRGAELSTDHHLVVSWIRWQRRKLDRPGRPKRIVRVCWERLAEPSVREVFNFHLRKSFSQIPREAGDIESEWTMFSASIVDAAGSKLWTQGLWCLPVVAATPPNPVVVDTGSKGCRQAEEGVLWDHVGLPVGLLTQLTGTVARPSKLQAARTVLEAKTSGLGGVRAGGELLTSTGDIVGRWKKYFEDLLNPTDLPSNEEAEAGEDHTSQPPQGRSTPGYWRGELGRWSNLPRIQEEQCGFRPGRGTLDQLYTLHRVLEGLWEFAQPVHMCFVDLEKAFDRVPRGILWGVLREYGVREPLLKGCSVSVLCCTTGAGAWFACTLPAVSQTCSQCMLDSGRACPLSPVLFIIFMDRISRRSQGPEGVRFGNHRISSLLFADDVVLMASSGQDLQHVLERFAAECEAAGMRISTSKSEAMVLDRKRVACPLQVGGEVLPQVEEFKYLGVLFTSEGKMEREIDRRIGAASAVMRSVYRTVVVKKELSRKAKLSIYRSIYVPTLTYGHELWVMTERTRSRIQAAEMSFLRRVAGRSLRDRVRSSVTREELGVEPLLLHIERSQLRWLGHLFRMPPGRLPREVFQACPTGRRPPGKTQDTLERLCLSAG
ncbi:hypothetical protein L3Q82_026220 [Scortum barcoo]|uniref:Uncharacterized protein n=1 Tax=Scortum barcoo TaxID=214431 RepID=A0ACB8WJ80_9TELE|nr:hypothetical protein L3Q82_026220 [Scortum barcoo]